MTTDRAPMDAAEWLGLLVAYCNPSDMADTLGAMAPMIPVLDGYPAWALCRASARAVEAFDRRRAVPSLSEIEKPLAGWIERVAPPIDERKRLIPPGGLQAILSATQSIREIGA